LEALLNKITYLIYIIIPIGLFILALTFFKSTPHEAVHIHAGFKIFLNNQLQDYSDDKYMNYSMCGEDGSYDDGYRTHLHNGIGDVLHVHIGGTTWRHFLEELGFDFKSNPTVAVLNGENVGDYLDRQIQDLDSIVIVAGDYTDFDQMTMNAVAKDWIVEVSHMPELCGI
jgi:hypothetical protein